MATGKAVARATSYRTRVPPPDLPGSRARLEVEFSCLWPVIHSTVHMERDLRALGLEHSKVGNELAAA